MRAMFVQASRADGEESGMRKGTKDAAWALLVLITATGSANRELAGAGLKNRDGNDGARATTAAPPPAQR